MDISAGTQGVTNKSPVREYIHLVLHQIAFSRKNVNERTPARVYDLGFIIIRKSCSYLNYRISFVLNIIYKSPRWVKKILYMLYNIILYRQVSYNVIGRHRILYIAVALPRQKLRRTCRESNEGPNSFWLAFDGASRAEVI